MRLYGSYIMPGLKTIDTNYNIQSHVEPRSVLLKQGAEKAKLGSTLFFIPTAFFQ